MSAPSNTISSMESLQVKRSPYAFPVERNTSMSDSWNLSAPQTLWAAPSANGKTGSGVRTRHSVVVQSTSDMKDLDGLQLTSCMSTQSRDVEVPARPTKSPSEARKRRTLSLTNIRNSISHGRKKSGPPQDQVGSVGIEPQHSRRVSGGEAECELLLCKPTLRSSTYML